ncbi:FCD domain-containing protein [Roseateles sp.]|uniref:FCD domain-containing protein n=1 Tax=Roseateles sp. TaxID=1971397 RepID=UPI00286C4237|nr:FCD domain-containing protein [Roseateles sp.]
MLAIEGKCWRQQIVTDLRRVMKLNRHHSLFKQGRLDESLAEHRALMAGIAERSGARAAAQMRAHFDNGLAAERTTLSPA